MASNSPTGKKVALIAVAALMIFLWACSGPPLPGDTQETTSPTEATSYVPPTDEVPVVRVAFRAGTAEYRQALGAEINRLLDESGAGVRVELRSANYRISSEDISLARAGIGQYDLLTLNALTTDFAALADAGLFTDMTDYLSQYPDLLAFHDQEIWREATLRGGTYWFPLLVTLNGIAMFDELTIDQSVLRTLGPTPFPQTYDEMAALLRAAKDRDLPYKLGCSVSLPPVALHRTYDEWPFYVDPDSLLIFYADGTMEPYIESEIFLKDAALLRELDAEGLLAWVKWTRSGPEATQDLGLAMGVIGAPLENVEEETSRLEPEKPIVRTHSAAMNALFIPASSKNPDAAMALIDELCANEKIMLALAYGIEGTDWRAGDDGLEMLSGVHSFLYLDHRVALPYLSDSQREHYEGPPTQSYPFTGYRFDQDDYGTFVGMYAYTGDEALRQAMDAMYDLRRGVLPMSNLDLVKKELYASGLQRIYEDNLARYTEFQRPPE